jgi:hypothetical protein
LQPEEIAISPPVYGDAETPGCADGEGSGACSPEWGIHHIEKEGRSLTVSAISDSTGEAQRRSYVLPDSDSDFVLRSGNQPPRLRVDRRFSLIRLDIKARIFGGVNTTGGEPTVGLTVEGPYGGDGVRIGGTLEYQLGG